MLSEILQSLYSSSLGKVLSVLNESIYITDFDKTNDTILFHTGIRFRTHKGTQFDVFYDLESKSIIRQPIGPYSRKAPQLIGFLCGIGQSKYVEKTYEWLVTSLSINELQNKIDKNILKGLAGADMEDLESLVVGSPPIAKVILVDDTGKKGIHTSFQIVKSDGNVLRLPLQKTLFQALYFDSFEFSLYDSLQFRRQDNYHEESNSFEFWTCDACGGSSSSGCMSSTGECYR